MQSTVLIVEAEPGITKNLESLLRANGYRTLVIGDRADALEEVAAVDVPDLILFPFGVEKRSGSNFLRALQEDPRFANVPIVAIDPPLKH